MAIRIAINGFGRIGRCVLRAIHEQGLTNEFQVVAINDLTSAEMNAHLLQYDTTHGRFGSQVTVENDQMYVDQHPIALYAERDPKQLPWGQLDVDVVFECTGMFCSKEKSQAHLQAGAKKVLISAPGGSDVDATVVNGVNDTVLTSQMSVVSNASCTTNCLAPVAKVLEDAFGIEHGLMTTVHAYTNDQNIVDAAHKDIRRARAGGHSIIPTKTGAAAAVGLVLPQLNGKLDGFAMRVPTINVSVVDLTVTLATDATVDQINQAIESASKHQLKGILGYNQAPLVSVDFNHDPRPSIFDATQTRVIGQRLVKVLAWYDNEWGFSNQMLATAAKWMQK